MVISYGFHRVSFDEFLLTSFFIRLAALLQEYAGFRITGSGFRVCCSGFWGLWYRVYGSMFITSVAVFDMIINTVLDVAICLGEYDKATVE